MATPPDNSLQFSRRSFLNRSTALAGLSLLPGAALTASAAESPPPSGDGRSPSVKDIFTVSDAEAIAETKIAPTFLAYLQGGAGDEITLRRNQEKFREIILNPRVLQDLNELNTERTLFGCDMSAPILFAPTATNRLFHDEGELAVARGASATNTTYVLSTTSHTSVEAVAQTTQSPLWFQLYVQADIPVALDLIRRAEAAGAKAICITVDNPVPGIRSRQERAGYRHPQELPLPHFANRSAKKTTAWDHVAPKKLNWKDVEKMVAHARVPVLLKGIMDARDAAIALDIGVAGIIVSNHGGRILDTVPATIEVLPEIAQSVAGRVPVLMDGGIRRGTDVIKALALGAQAVLVGRPYLYGLASAGAEGVAHIKRILHRELRVGMAMLGCSNLDAITADVLRRS